MAQKVYQTGGGVDGAVEDIRVVSNNDVNLDDTADNAAAFNATGTVITNTLFRVDLSGIPAGSTIDSAVLALVITQNGSQGSVQFRRVLPTNDWVEAQAQWTLRKTGAAWIGTNGCETANTDYDGDASPLASNPSMPVGAVNITFTTAEFQTLFDDATEEGWIVREETRTGNRFVTWKSSGHATGADRPKLTVTYTPPKGNFLLLGVG